MLTDLSDEQGFRLAPLTELGVELPPLPYYLQPKVEKKPSESEDLFFRQRNSHFVLLNSIKFGVEVAPAQGRMHWGMRLICISFILRRAASFSHSSSFKQKNPPIIYLALSSPPQD